VKQIGDDGTHLDGGSHWVRIQDRLSRGTERGLNLLVSYYGLSGFNFGLVVCVLSYSPAYAWKATLEEFLCPNFLVEESERRGGFLSIGHGLWSIAASCFARAVDA
jgi:hypothetical protein